VPLKLLVDWHLPVLSSSKLLKLSRCVKGCKALVPGGGGGGGGSCQTSGGSGGKGCDKVGTDG